MLSILLALSPEHEAQDAEFRIERVVDLNTSMIDFVLQLYR